MIGGFRNKALRDLFMHGKAAKISPKLRQRCLSRLDSLDAAKSLKSLDLPGFRLHGLQGKPKRYSLWVNGPWRITFEWVDGKAERVDLEQYH